MTAETNNNQVVSRQVCFFAAFVLPVYKLLEAPSVLARFTKGDLLLPALLQYLFQTGVLIALLCAASRSEKPLVVRMREKLGKWSLAVYAVYGIYFLFAAILPLLDLEKLVYAVFFDTSPTVFSFAFFFLFSAFVCTKGFKALGRSADLSLFLFLLPFLALIAMSLNEADATNLLPVFEQKFQATVYAFNHTTPHFSDAVFLLPLIANMSYKKGDGKKILAGYGVGAAFTLLFLAVFYTLYSTLAPREHYAFAKIAQYFPALTVIGRIDLIFVYMLCIVLFFYVTTPLFYTVDATARLFQTERKTLFSAIINVGAFVFVLFCNKYYDGFYEVIGGKLFPVFWLFADLLPLGCLFIKEKANAKNTRQ